jgi:hypothetical protein
MGWLCNGKRDLVTVGGFGALGGLLGWAVMRWDGVPPRFGTWLDAPFSTVLGCAAALIFVFLVSNTDRKDHPRFISLALLAGLAWRPSLDAGLAIIEKRNELQQNQAVTTALLAFEQNLATLAKTGDSAQQDEIRKQINEHLAVMDREAQKTDSIAMQSKLKTSIASLRNLEKFEGILSLDSFKNLRVLISEDPAPIAPKDIPTLNPEKKLGGTQAPEAWYRFDPAKIKDYQVTPGKSPFFTEIYDANNKLIYKFDAVSQDFPALKNGDYLLRFTTEGQNPLPEFQLQTKLPAKTEVQQKND